MDDYAEYIHMIRGIALRLIKGYRNDLAIDDLVAAGLLGLCEARNKYDPDKGSSFKTFSYRRIIGAMIDQQRFLYWSKKGHPVGSRMVSMDEMFETGNNEGNWQISPDPSPEQVCEQGLISELWRDRLNCLSERHRKVIVDHYFHDMSKKDIGDSMGVSDARIGQIHNEAINILRKMMFEN